MSHPLSPAETHRADMTLGSWGLRFTDGAMEADYRWKPVQPSACPRRSRSRVPRARLPSVPLGWIQAKLHARLAAPLVDPLEIVSGFLLTVAAIPNVWMHPDEIDGVLLGLCADGAVREFRLKKRAVAA